MKENEKDQYTQIVESYKLLNQGRLNELYLGLEAGKKQALSETLKGARLTQRRSMLQ